MREFLSNLLVIFALLCFSLLGFALYERNNPQRVAFRTPVPQVQAVEKEIIVQPTKIQIKAVNISLPIFPTHIINGQWQTTNEGVSYLTDSPIPGNIGNSILYGHNWNNLLGPLVKVKPGDTINIAYTNSTVKTFEVEYTVEVTPNDTGILAPSKDKRITIYTCSGFLDWKRFVVVGILKK
jgi:LPXTG-site transpeptidase (sortase) family protein